jgi:hypothetical protein
MVSETKYFKIASHPRIYPEESHISMQLFLFCAKILNFRDIENTILSLVVIVPQITFIVNEHIIQDADFQHI